MQASHFLISSLPCSHNLTPTLESPNHTLRVQVRSAATCPFRVKLRIGAATPPTIDFTELPTMNHDQGTQGSTHRSSSQKTPREIARAAQYDTRPIKRTRKVEKEESILFHSTPYRPHTCNTRTLKYYPYPHNIDKTGQDRGGCVCACEPVTTPQDPKSKAASYLPVSPLHDASCVACNAAPAPGIGKK